MQKEKKTRLKISHKTKFYKKKFARKMYKNRSQKLL